MAEFVFWEPYNKAKLYGDFRDLIKAIRDGHPMIAEPAVRSLIADQLQTPSNPSRKTKSRDGWPYAEEVQAVMWENGVTKYRAQEIILGRHPNLNRKTLEGYCADYQKAAEIHRRIIE